MDSTQRKELLLGIVLAIFLFIVLGIGWFFWQRSSPEQATIERRGYLTALPAYANAEARALSWTADAQLLSAQNTWTLDENGRFAKFDWGFIFYSPAENRSISVTVGETAVSMGNPRTVITGPQPANSALWQIDSLAVADEILKMARVEQMEHQEATTLTFLLNMDDTPVWTTTIFNRETGYFLRVTTDANSGDIVDIEQAVITMPPSP